MARSLRQDRKTGQALTLPPTPELAELTREIAALARPSVPAAPCKPRRRLAGGATSQLEHPPLASTASMTRSGLFDAPPETERVSSTRTCRAISRPSTWSIGSSRPGFTGSNRAPPNRSSWAGRSTELRQKSFLDVIHPDDRPRAAKTLRKASSGARPWA